MHRSRHFSASALAIAGSAALAPAPLAADTAAEVAALRREFAAERAALLGAELARYGRELAALEMEMAAARDYRGAVAVQRERLRLEGGTAGGGAAAAPAAPAGATPGEPVGLILPAADASPGGGVRVEASSGTLVGWDSEGAHAEWALPAGWPAGGYEIEVTHSAGGGGRFTLREERFSLTREAEATGGPQEPFVTRRLGTLRMTAGASALRIESGPGAPPAGFALRQLRLVPNDPGSKKP